MCSMPAMSAQVLASCLRWTATGIGMKSAQPVRLCGRTSIHPISSGRGTACTARGSSMPRELRCSCSRRDSVLFCAACLGGSGGQPYVSAAAPVHSLRYHPAIAPKTVWAGRQNSKALNVMDRLLYMFSPSVPNPDPNPNDKPYINPNQPQRFLRAGDGGDGGDALQHRHLGDDGVRERRNQMARPAARRTGALRAAALALRAAPGRGALAGPQFHKFTRLLVPIAASTGVQSAFHWPELNLASYILGLDTILPRMSGRLVSVLLAEAGNSLPETGNDVLEGWA